MIQKVCGGTVNLLEKKRKSVNVCVLNGNTVCFHGQIRMFVIYFSSAGRENPISCCTEIKRTNVRVTKIVNYVHQDEPQCPIKAVRQVKPIEFYS